MSRPRSLPSSLRGLAALLPALALVVGCTTQTTPLMRGMRTPHAIALTCVGPDGKPVAISDPACTSDTVRAFVTGNGTLSIAVPSVRTWVDNDPSAPGFTPLEMPGFPGALTMDPLRGHAYVALPILGWVLRVDISGLATYDFKVLDWQDFDAPVESMVVVEQPEPRLYMADPSRGGVWWIRLEHFAKSIDGQSISPKFIATGGAPSSLAVSTLNHHIYVGHLSAGFVSVIDPVSDLSVGTVAQISITRACSDGLDNDGDGRTDRDDRGCDDAKDADERDPEVGVVACNDHEDNDGDGLRDVGQDPGCVVGPFLIQADACRNGVDDDGDGTTDYVAGPGGDPGCSGWGDTSEWSDRPACPPSMSACMQLDQKWLFTITQTFCQDGVDNDGDGQTDSADPDCAVPGSNSEGLGGCHNGVDDDGDGLTDTADVDCYNEGSPAEVSVATAIRSVVAATFGGEFVVVADRTRRALLVIDAATDTLLPVNPGSTSPWARPSPFDVRDGVPGLTLADMPISLAAASVADTVPLGEGTTTVEQPLMAIGLAQAGVQFLRFHPWGDAKTVSVDMWETPREVTATTSAGRPLLLIPGAVLDLPTTVPSRYAALGQLVLTTDAAGATVYYGLHPKLDNATHRTETWRFRAEAVIPGGVGEGARLLGDGLLDDPRTDFCQVGVLPGDWVQLNLPANEACAGGGAYVFRVVEVTQTGLAFDPTTGVLDVAVTNDTQLTFDSATRKPFVGSIQTCLATGRVNYVVRSNGWLVGGSRSRLLSSRPAVDGRCAVLPDELAFAARLVEPSLLPGKSVADLLTCPNAGEPLDESVWHVPTFAHPVFTAQIKTGCDASTFDQSGNRIVRLVPTIRDAEWVYGVSAAFSPRTSPAGANPVSLASGPNLGIVYVVDEGSGQMQFLGVASGLLLATPLN